MEITCFDFLETIAVGVDGCGVGVLLAHLYPERRAGNVDAVELAVDVVDSVLVRHEAHRVGVGVDQLDEAVVLST